MPGWISKHEASYDPTGIITIKGGQVVRERGGKQQILRNFEDYALHMTSGVWQRLTNRNWHEFSIRQQEGLFVLKQSPKSEALLPRHIEHVIVLCEDEEDARVIVAGVPVSLTVGVQYRGRCRGGYAGAFVGSDGRRDSCQHRRSRSASVRSGTRVSYRPDRSIGT